MGAESKPTNSRSSIRRAATLLTLIFWVTGTVTMAVSGRYPLPRAAAVAAVAALAGLLCLAIYRRVSHRTDGLASFIVAFVVIGDRRVGLPWHEDLVWEVPKIAYLAVLHVVIGLCVRVRRKGAGQAVGSPLRGAQLDPPPSP